MVNWVIKRVKSVHLGCFVKLSKWTLFTRISAQITKITITMSEYRTIRLSYIIRVSYQHSLPFDFAKTETVPLKYKKDTFYHNFGPNNEKFPFHGVVEYI